MNKPARILSNAGLALFFLAAYLAATHIGLILRIEAGGLTPLWPASGLALVLLLKRGLAWWPLIVVGELLTAWSLDQPLSMGLAGGAGQSLEAAVAVLLLHRTAARDWFRNIPETVQFCVLVCCVPPLLSASVGTLAQYAHGLLSIPTWKTGWVTWWLGDAMGLLIVAPFLMTWWPIPFRDWRTALEWLGVAALLSVTGLVLTSYTGERGHHLFFLLLPFVGWLALRFRAAGASSAAVLLSALVFGLSDTSDDFTTAIYIAFVGASASMGYLLSAILNRQHVLLDQFRHRADHDPLTGLCSRSRLEAELRRLTEQRSDSVGHALIYLDLDRFKMVNDACGHEAGDRFLVDLAAHLADIPPAAATFARMGGDEFGVLLRNVSESEAGTLGESLRNAMAEYSFTCGDYQFSLGASIGVAHFRPGEAAATVLSRADIACHTAKEEGRDLVHVYSAGDLAMQRHQSELEWVSQFRHAMAEGQLVLFAQRIAAVTGPDETPFFEVLLRKIENGEPVSPGRFLPAADRYGLMPAIDRWVMTECFRTIAARPSDDFRLSINLAPATLDRPRFLESVEHLSSEFGVDPARICFEVTEKIAIRDMEGAVKTLRRLSDLGFQFALDDFGSGVASFGYLSQLPVDYVKIDGQFVRSLQDDRASWIIVSALKELAALRGIQCVAEWVESAATMDALDRIGVEYAQGYHVHVPEALEPLLTAAYGHITGR